MTAVLFALVAAGATLVRAAWTADQPAGELPWRTLSINVAGAFALGIALGSAWLTDSVVVAMAGLGSATTFSTVAAEVAALLDDGRRRQAMAYVGLSVVVGILAAWLGLSIGEKL